MTDREIYAEIQKTADMGARMAREMMRHSDDEEFRLELVCVENSYRQLMDEAREKTEKSGKGSVRSLSVLTSAEIGSMNDSAEEEKAQALIKRLIELEKTHRAVYKSFLS